MNFLSGLGRGLTQGAERQIAEQREEPFRQERLAQAKAQTALAQEQVDSAPLRKSNQELQNEMLQMQVRQGQNQQLKQQSFDAFRLYNSDGDAKHLNTFYNDAKRTPQGQNMFGQVARVDNLERTAETERMLKQAGIQDLDGFFSDPELVKQLVVTTQTNGQRVLTDMAQVYAGTGFTNYMNNEQLDLMTKQAGLMRAMQGGQSHQNVTSRERIAREMAEQTGMPVYEAYMKLDQKAGSTSNLDKLTRAILEENPGMSDMEAYDMALRKLKSTETERYVDDKVSATGDDRVSVTEEVRARKARTSTQKNIEATQGIRDEIEALRTEGYDATNPADRRKMGLLITDLEAITGRKMPTEDRRVVRELRNLTNLGATAGAQITDAETGPLDYMMKNVRKYISDNVSGTEATTSYEQFRNVFRNALYGATLTNAEIEAFTRAAGSLSQQRGPALSALRTQMQSVRNNLQSIYDMNDPDIAEYYLGMSLDDADRAIEGLDERLQMMQGYVSDNDIVTAAPEAESSERPSLSTIFGG